MPFSFSLWMIAVAIAVLLLAPLVLELYEYYLHPAWRKERRVVRACEKAFDDGKYRLERLRTSLDDPSFSDLFPSPLLFGEAEKTPRYFTYNLETVGDAEPDFSGMTAREISLIRRYLHRSTVPHHGKKILRSIENEESVDEQSTVR